MFFCIRHGRHFRYFFSGLASNRSEIESRRTHVIKLIDRQLCEISDRGAVYVVIGRDKIAGKYI